MDNLCMSCGKPLYEGKSSTATPDLCSCQPSTHEGKIMLEYLKDIKRLIEEGFLK